MSYTETMEAVDSLILSLSTPIPPVRSDWKRTLGESLSELRAIEAHIETLQRRNAVANQSIVVKAERCGGIDQGVARSILATEKSIEALVKRPRLPVSEDDVGKRQENIKEAEKLLSSLQKKLKVLRTICPGAVKRIPYFKEKDHLHSTGAQRVVGWEFKELGGRRVEVELKDDMDEFDLCNAVWATLDNMESSSVTVSIS